MSDMNTLHLLLTAGQDDAVALGAPGRPSLTYRDLRTHVDQTVTTLNHLGIGRNDRVACVLHIILAQVRSATVAPTRFAIG